MDILKRTWGRFSTWINRPPSTLSISSNHVEAENHKNKIFTALDEALRNRAADLDEREKLIEEREQKLFAWEKENAGNALSEFDSDPYPAGENINDTNRSEFSENKAEACKVNPSDPLEGPGYRSSEKNYQLGREILARYDSDRSASKNELREMYFLFRRASERGHIEATYELSLCYADGRGVAASGKRARALLVSAARGGSCRAQHTIGRFMLQGNLFPLNTPQALYWIRKASAQNYAPAVELLKSYPEAPIRTVVSASSVANRRSSRAAILHVPEKGLPSKERHRMHAIGRKVGSICARRTMRGQTLSPVHDDRSIFEAHARGVAERRGYLDPYSTEGMGDFDGSDPFALEYRSHFIEGVEEGIRDFFDEQ